MKIKYLEIKNFKQFKDLTLDLAYPQGHPKEGQPLDKICIIGQSGTGKTNLLEIIKKSVIDFSDRESSYKPFSEFTGQSTDNQYITNVFWTKSNITVGALFTKDKSKIDFKKSINDLFSLFEKNYFVGVDRISIPSIVDEINQSSMTETDRLILEGYVKYREEIISNGMRAYGPDIFESMMRDADKKISDFQQKYHSVENSLKKLKSQNFIDRYIVNVNDENENIWEIMKSKIDDYQNLRTKYIELLSSKLLDDDTYSKENYKEDILEWEGKNENLLEKTSLVLNDILKYFNLELSKIDENQRSYQGLIFRDLSNGNIIEYENLSTGTKNLISTFIPLKAYSPQDSILLIDEPENSFYPDIQRQLTELYMEAGENNQVIFATHSPIIASSFEPWEVVELKFDKNNQVYREKYFEGDIDHIDNYTLDPRMLTWTGILTDIFDIKSSSNSDFRENALIEFNILKEEIKNIEDIEKKEELFKKLQNLGKKLGIYNQ